MPLKDLFNRHRKLIICVFSIMFIIFASLLLVYKFLNLKDIDLKIPLYYTGSDDFLNLSLAKTMQDYGWVFSNNHLGAPFGTTFYDFQTILLDNFDNLILKILVTTGNIATAVNLQYILLFPLISLISYYVMRELKVHNIVSIMGSLTYAFLPFIFVRYVHFALCTYQFIPLSILLCIWLFTDDNFFAFKKGFFKYRKNILALIFILLISNNGIFYYPFFTCFFLFITGLSVSIKNKKLSPIIRSLSAVGIIVFMLIIDMIPYFIYVMKNGVDTLVAQRSKTEAEIYGLKIVQLYLPINGHGIKKLTNLITFYNQNAPLVNENSTAYLGIAGVIGFTFLLIYIFVRKVKERNPLEILSELNLFAVLLATIGGFSSLIAITVFQNIRGYNRISVFIAYFSILAICLLIDNYRNKLKKMVLKIAFFAAIIVFFMGSIYEQFPCNPPDYAGAKASYISDDNFVRQIEASVPKGSMIYEMPYHQYPESGPVNAMSDYQLLAPSFHSNNLRWSYGGMKGRISDDWNGKVASLSIEKTVEVISLANFQGIYIDDRAYKADDLSQLIVNIENILKVKPEYSENNELTFFNMSEYNKALKSKYTDEQWTSLNKQVLSNPLFLKT